MLPLVGLHASVRLLDFHVGAVLREMTGNGAVSQEKVAEALGTSRQTVHARIREGARRPAVGAGQPSLPLAVATVMSAEPRPLPLLEVVERVHRIMPSEDRGGLVRRVNALLAEWGEKRRVSIVEIEGACAFQLTETYVLEVSATTRGENITGIRGAVLDHLHYHERTKDLSGIGTRTRFRRTFHLVRGLVAPFTEDLRSAIRAVGDRYEALARQRRMERDALPAELWSDEDIDIAWELIYVGSDLEFRPWKTGPPTK
ncbi:MAG: winged helix-turn-helix domain-containing protein [Myxococcota bacterium]